MSLSPDRPLAGILAPLFALRAEHDLGIGDVGALRELIDWAAEQGFALVQLLPINETGGDFSPYNAISSVALDPLTIEIGPDRIADLPGHFYTDEVSKEIDPGLVAELSRGPVQYARVKALKMRLLARAFEWFTSQSWTRNDARGRAFRAFCKSEAAWLEDYALFRVLIDENGGSEKWDEWPRSSAAQARRGRGWRSAGWRRSAGSWRWRCVSPCIGNSSRGSSGAR